MPWKTGANPGEHPERRSLLCPPNALGHGYHPFICWVLFSPESKCLRKNSCSKLGHKRPNHCCRCGKLRDSYPQRLANGKNSSRICLLWAVDTTEDIHYGRSACFRHSLTEHWTSDSERIGHKTQPTTQLNMVGCSCGWSAKRLAVGWAMLSNFAVSKLQLLKNTHCKLSLYLFLSKKAPRLFLTFVACFANSPTSLLYSKTGLCPTPRDAAATWWQKGRPKPRNRFTLPVVISVSRYAKYPKDFLWAPSPMRLFDDVLCGFSFHGLGSKQLQVQANTVFQNLKFRAEGFTRKPNGIHFEEQGFAPSGNR